jgi:hypothetical protein
MENQFSIQLTEKAIDALKESAKWSYFLAILGFIGIGLMVLAGVFMGSVMSMMPDQPGMGAFGAIKGFMSLIYIVMALLYFFPVYYFFKYASGTKEALNTDNSEQLADALVNLKSHHKFLGIMAIVIISFYILLFFTAIVGGIFAAAS